MRRDADKDREARDGADQAEATAQASTPAARKVAQAGVAAAKHGGSVAGKTAVNRAANARMVADTIERTHTRQAAKAASRSQFLKARAGSIKQAAERASKEGRHLGGREQLKGHFIEALDVKSYNAKGRLIRKALSPRKGSTNKAYDASRVVNKKFAGAIQQKSSAAGAEKAIVQMESAKLGAARRGTLRVPRDHVAETRRRAANRIRVKGMDFTSKQAEAKLDRGLGDLAKKGSNAGSTVRAAAKGATIGAAINVAVGAAGDAGGLKRGELAPRHFTENRAVDAAEGVTNALVGVGAATVGSAAGSAALGAALATSVGSTAAMSIGAASTAAVTAISGVGTVGAGVAGVLGGVTVAGAAPVVVSGAAVIGSGLIVGRTYEHVRRRLQASQQQRLLLAAKRANELPAPDRHDAGEPIRAADVVQAEIDMYVLPRRSRSDFSQEEIARIRQLLIELRVARPGAGGRQRAALRGLGFYLSDWTPATGSFGVEDLDGLIAHGQISVINT